MSEKPFSENTRASARVDTVMAPSCSAVWIRATSIHLCVFICGRRRTPLRVAISLTRSAFFLTRSMSRTRHGVFRFSIRRRISSYRPTLFTISDFVMSNSSEDPFDLARFVLAQQNTYDHAVSEIRRGRKETHWMWFIFPQFAGLGFSYQSQLYAIKSLGEARAYLQHPILGPRLVDITKAGFEVKGKPA